MKKDIKTIKRETLFQKNYSIFVPKNEIHVYGKHLTQEEKLVLYNVFFDVFYEGVTSGVVILIDNHFFISEIKKPIENGEINIEGVICSPSLEKEAREYIEMRQKQEKEKDDLRKKHVNMFDKHINDIQTIIWTYYLSPIDIKRLELAQERVIRYSELQ